MIRHATLLSLLLQLACLAPVAQTALVASPATRFEIVRLRGGLAAEGGDGGEEEDMLDEDLDDLEAGMDAPAAGGDDALENPFLGGAGGDASGPLGELSQTLNDPAMMREALKELQDPAAQERMRAMMEDPEFQKSMRQYVEQISKDPQFEMLRQQTEKLMQEPDFVEQISKAFAGLGGEPPKDGSDSE
jgi:hypothetical protein